MSVIESPKVADVTSGGYRWYCDLCEVDHPCKPVGGDIVVDCDPAMCTHAGEIKTDFRWEA